MTKPIVGVRIRDIRRDKEAVASGKTPLKHTAQDEVTQAAVRDSIQTMFTALKRAAGKNRIVNADEYGAMLLRVASKETGKYDLPLKGVHTNKSARHFATDALIGLGRDSFEEPGRTKDAPVFSKGIGEDMTTGAYFYVANALYELNSFGAADPASTTCHSPARGKLIEFLKLRKKGSGAENLSNGKLLAAVRAAIKPAEYAPWTNRTPPTELDNLTYSVVLGALASSRDTLK